MGIASYSELKDAIKDFAVREDFGTGPLDDMIRLAEAKIEREFRVREMILTTTGNFVSGTETVTVPAGWIGNEVFRITVASSLPAIPEYVAPDVFFTFQIQGETGLPRVFTVIGTEAHFARTPDSNYAYTWDYYARFGSNALSSSNPTNDFLDAYPDVYLWACLSEAGSYVHDDAQVARWEAKYERAKASAHAAKRRGRASGGRLRVRPTFGGP